MDKDLLLARKLQAEFDRESGGRSVEAQPCTEDEASLQLARRLQEEFETESANVEMAPFLPPEFRTPSKSRSSSKPVSCVSAEWETIDPTPDLHALFLEFNQTFFWGKLVMCEVRWSPRMYTCAGICRYSPRERFCTIGISIPLLKLRPRKDLVETLLHEMIHAFLFITDNNDNHDGHGPEFHKHMYRINAATGANISVYHTFHDEVELYKQHWWRCDGPCTKRPPFYGFVKRTMNRPPAPRDRWWPQHQQSCGGSFVKVREPDGFGKKGKKGKEEKSQSGKTESSDIRKFFDGNNKENKTAGENSRVRGLLDANALPNINTGVKSKVKGTKPPSSGRAGRPGVSRSEGGPGVSGGGGRGNIFGFGGTSFSGVSGAKAGKKTGTIVVRPGQRPVEDNSRGGEPLTGPASPASLPVGPGQRLGGGTAGGGEAAAAREAVRRKWAQTSSSQPASQDRNKSKEVTEEKDRNRELPEESVECPVCSKRFSHSAINTHLDSCLAPPEPSLDDGEDEALLAAAIECEKSFNASRGSPIVVSDSDSDDEPLVKKRPRESSGDLMTQQDDEDILTALDGSQEAKEEAEESMFACPICDELLQHQNMFSHLEVCTQNI